MFHFLRLVCLFILFESGFYVFSMYAVTQTTPEKKESHTQEDLCARKKAWAVSLSPSALYLDLSQL